MKPTITPITSEEQWLKLRVGRVTATAVPALFGASQWLTKWQLYHRLKTGVSEGFEETQEMRWGKRLEPAIGAGICEDQGWEGEPFKVFATHGAIARLGCSPDWRITSIHQPELGWGLLELKNISLWQHKRAWIDGDEEEAEAPIDAEVQLQTQLEIFGYDWGAIGGLVGGNKPVVLVRKRDKDLGRKIRQEVTSFLDDLDNDREPEPDFDRDGEKLRQLYVNVRDVGFPVDMTGDNRLTVLCAAYKDAAAREASAEKLKKAAMAEILTIIQDLAQVTCGPYKLSSTYVPETEVSYTRKPYRTTRITERKAKPHE